MTATALAASSAGAELPLAAANWLRIGQEHYAAGRNDDAFAAFQLGLAAARGSNRQANIPIETIAELHSNLGNAWMVRGDLELAAANYKAALRLVPKLTACWCNLGNMHVQTGKAAGCHRAIIFEALKLNPRHWASRTNLVQALIGHQAIHHRQGAAAGTARRAAAGGALHHQLGKVHYELDEVKSAITCFEQAIALNPRDADSLYWIGGIRQQPDDDRSRAGRLCPSCANPALNPAAGDQIAGRFPRAGAVCPVRRQHADRISVQECRLRYRHPRDIRVQLLRPRSLQAGR